MTNIYVDQDTIGGSDNGTDWGNAYNTSDALQDALDDIPATAVENVFIYIRNSVSSTEYTVATELIQDSGGSTVSNVNNYWVKVIGCDSAGDPITVSGTRIKIRLTSASGSVWTLNPGAGTEISRCVFYNIWFHGDDNCASGFEMENDNAASSYFFGFVNCEFSHATTQPFRIETDFRCTSFYDCYFHDGNTYSIYINGNGCTFVKCKFLADSGGTYACYIPGSDNYTFYDCIFDANARAYSLLIGGYYSNTFINSAFVNATLANILSSGAGGSNNFINCVGEVNVPASDYVYKKDASSDGPAGLIIGNIGNSSVALGEWEDHDDLLAPFIVSGSLNTDQSSGDIISASDYRWDNRIEATKGHADRYGNKAMVGVENKRAAETQAVSKSQQSLVGNPITGAF